MPSLSVEFHHTIYPVTTATFTALVFLKIHDKLVDERTERDMCAFVPGKSN